MLLRAMDILGEDFDGELHIYGGNLDMQDPRWQERFADLLRRAPQRDLHPRLRP